METIQGITIGEKESVKKEPPRQTKKKKENPIVSCDLLLSLSVTHDVLKIPLSLSSSVQSLSASLFPVWLKRKGVRFRVFARFLSGSWSMSSSSQSFSAGRPSPLASPSQSHRFCGPSATSSGGGSFDTLNRVITDLCSHGNPKVTNAKILRSFGLLKLVETQKKLSELNV